MRLTVYPILGLVFFASVAMAATGNRLLVQGNAVNVREAPSTNAAIVLQLNLGHELLEIRRSGDWVNVGIARTDGKDGWVHASLVGAYSPGGGIVVPPDPKFDKFLQALWGINYLAKTMGFDLFIGAENLGDGIINVTTTDVWLSTPNDIRHDNLNTLFNLWDAAEGTGLPILVRIVDGRGRVVMEKGRDLIQ